MFLDTFSSIETALCSPLCHLQKQHPRREDGAASTQIYLLLHLLFPQAIRWEELSGSV